MEEKGVVVVVLDDGEKYRLGEELGEGVFSKVFKARNCDTDEEFALKLTRPRYITVAVEEREFLEKIHKKSHKYNQFLARCIGGGPYLKSYIIVMPQLQMSLASYLDHKNTHIMPAKDVISLCFQVLCALERLRELHIVHSDLKPDNILFSEEGVRKTYDQNEEETYTLVNPTFVLTDMNTAHRLGPGEFAKGLVQTSNYRSPEVVIAMPWTAKIDIFSLGAMVAEALIGHLIFSPEEDIGDKPSVEERLIHASLIEHCCGPISDYMFNLSTIPELKRARFGKPFPTLNNKKLFPDWKRIYSDQEFFDEAMTLAIVMLAVDPDNRPAADDLLKFKVFNEFHKALNEK